MVSISLSELCRIVLTVHPGWLENEPATIPDPDAEKPEEWDDEEDGDWVAPSVP